MQFLRDIISKLKCKMQMLLISSSGTGVLGITFVFASFPALSVEMVQYSKEEKQLSCSIFCNTLIDGNVSLHFF